MNIATNDLKKLIEPHFQGDLTKDYYEIKTIKAINLLTHTRLDLAFKLLYLDMINKDSAFAKKVYEEHIRAFSLGNFTEFGNKNKNGINSFIKEFDVTFESIKKNGFDCRKTIVPLSKNKSIANGAHRVSSAIYMDIDVGCVQIDTADHIYNYKFFYERNVSNEILDAVVTKFIEYANNTYIAFIWPTAQGHDKEIEEIVPRIVYKKEIKLNPNGAHNLLSQIYYGEEWLGRVEDNFSGSKGKLVECFTNFNPVRIVVFQEDSLNNVLKIKDKIRNIFNIGKHSVHITDTKEEAIRASHIVLNDNSIHFLNYAKPNKYIATHRNIDKFKKFIVDNKLNTDDVVLDGSIILSVYGLRESRDIDYFSSIKIENKEFEAHDEELMYHKKEKSDIIYNPANYFYFNGLKFVSFAQLYKMKKNRHEKKDINDCKMMEALIENNNLKKLINGIKQDLFYINIKARAKLIIFLKGIGLFCIAKRIYGVLKGNIKNDRH